MAKEKWNRMKEKEIRGNPFRNALNQIRVKFTKNRHFLKSISLTALQLGPNVTRLVGSRHLLYFVGTSRTIRWNSLATASHHRMRLTSWVELYYCWNITAFSAQFITYWGVSGDLQNLSSLTTNFSTLFLRLSCIPSATAVSEASSSLSIGYLRTSIQILLSEYHSF